MALGVGNLKIVQQFFFTQVIEKVTSQIEYKNFFGFGEVHEKGLVIARDGLNNNAR